LATANQGTECRRGRGVASLEIWHGDVIEFIEYKKKYGVVSIQNNDSLGTVLRIPDIFMRRLNQDADWTLFNSEDANGLHQLYGDEFDNKSEEIEQNVIAGKVSGKSITCREI